jgi:hypothetical protein
MEAGVALKDLIADKGALDEATIERIVGPYLRYDVETQELSFLQPFAGLSNKAKILVYLVGLQGWKFVTDDTVATDARPADIETATGIPGGSLRPILRGLCDNHVLSERGSRYSVRGTSLRVIEAELKGNREGTAVPLTRPPRRKASRRSRDVGDANDDDTQTDEEAAGVGLKRGRKPGGKTGNIAATFERWIDEGYFDEPRTLADVQKRFRREAIMVPQSSLPGYFLGAVRKGRLNREEMTAGGRTVWAYTTSTKPAK